jgi:glycerol-3-phosphate O-acyltransferase
MTDRPPLHRTSALAIPGRGVPQRRRGIQGRLLEPFFGRTLVQQDAIDRLRKAHQEGVVIHTLRFHRLVDPLYIQYLLEQLDLPLPTWLHDHVVARNSISSRELVERVSARESALLFLRKPHTLITGSTAYGESYVESLLELQRTMDRPILLLPEALIWSKRAVALKRSMVDDVFGDREAPGHLRELLGFWWHHKDSRFHVGAPIDLQDALRREAGQPDPVIAKKVRWLILHHLGREEQLRTGPRHRSVKRTIQQVTNEPQLRKQIRALADKSGSETKLVARAQTMLRGIAADMRYGWLSVLDVFIDWLWNRIYDGIAVDPDGMEKVRSAARKGPVVVVPSHKSHIDYIVLSQVFFKEGMMPPYIAAGENLNFFPMGPVFRRAGAFFIRRSFKGDKLYAAVFAAYVRRLLKDGHAIEFFIEGGRSRTGRLLRPRLGMLGMCIDPVLDGAVPDLSIVPVSIGYEKVVEAKAYAKELAGETKKREDFKALIKSGPKVLRSRYGRVYVDFGDPISVTRFAEARGLHPGEPGEHDAHRRRQITSQLGHRIVYGINEVTRVTPTSVVALTLLSRTQRGIGEDELVEEADRVLQFLAEIGARVSGTLQPEHRREAIREALGRFEADGSVRTAPAPDGATIYQFDSAGRSALDFYKNNVLHYFVPCAVVAMALVLEPRSTDPDVRARARRISQLLKHEVSFKVDADFDQNFDDALSVLERRGAVRRVGALRAAETTLEVHNDGHREVVQLAGTLGVFFECLRLAAESLSRLHERPLSQPELIRQALMAAQRQALEGRIQRPEAATQPGLTTSIVWLVDQDILRRGENGLEVCDEDARLALVDELSRHLQAIG